MQRRTRVARLVIGSLMAVGLLVGAQPEAKADCLWLKLYIHRHNTTPMWVYGENDPCVAPTPFNHGLGQYHGLNNTNLPPQTPTGTPTGFYVEWKTPLP